VALRLAMGTPGQRPSEIEDQVTSFLRYVEALRLSGIRAWFAVLGPHIISSCTSVPSAGRTSMLLLPREAASPQSDEATRLLIDEAVAAESRNRTSLLQCLLEPRDEENVCRLHAMGFFDVAELIYMERWKTQSAVKDSAEANTSQWITYGAPSHAMFAEVIAESYIDTMDCQALRGLRDIEDVIAGHKAAGLFSPQRWLMRCDGDEPQGCILLGENPIHPTLEVAYIGVRPMHRRRGVAKALMSRAVALAASENFERMTLAVDKMNTPAISLYEQIGFRHLTRRRALVKPLLSSPRQP
jgi:ribosomal protein S18 acetylase RimI-like enzyme